MSHYQGLTLLVMGICIVVSIIMGYNSLVFSLMFLCVPIYIILGALEE